MCFSKVNVAAPAGSVTCSGHALVVCSFRVATPRVSQHQHKLPATYLPIMAEKMEGIQMGVDPSKYPVPIET
jgi:hypothetical protein